jgi:hypothetical protein
MTATEKLDSLQKCGVDDAIKAIEEAVQFLGHDRVRTTTEGAAINRILNNALNALYDEYCGLEDAEDAEEQKND